MEAAESRVDDITGWCNQKGFADILAMETQRARRYGGALCLCVMGIEIETADPDTGYETRIRNLSAIGRGLSKRVRGSDILCRLSDDMFGILMPQTSEAEARTLIERVEAYLKTKRLDTEGLCRHINYLR